MTKICDLCDGTLSPILLAALALAVCSNCAIERVGDRCNIRHFANLTPDLVACSRQVKLRNVPSHEEQFSLCPRWSLRVRIVSGPNPGESAGTDSVRGDKKETQDVELAADSRRVHKPLWPRYQEWADHGQLGWFSTHDSILKQQYIFRPVCSSQEIRLPWRSAKAILVRH